MKNFIPILTLIGALILLGVLSGASLCYYAYKTGWTRGELAEKERAFSKEEAIPLPDFNPPVGESGSSTGAGMPSPKREKQTPGLEAGSRALSRPHTDPRFPQTEVHLFGPYECVRAIWPVEILPSSQAVDHPSFRIRQGVNRFVRADSGLAEFALATQKSGYLTVVIRGRFSDDCGNSLTCSVDGSRATFMGNQKIYNKWIWVNAYRRFKVSPGIHRITLQSQEDGFEFDRVACIIGPGNRKKVPADFLADAPVTSPPVFEDLPVLSGSLPEVSRASFQAFCSQSLVIGKGHENMLVLFARLNSETSLEGQFHISSPFGKFDRSIPFVLTPQKRILLREISIKLIPKWYFRVPVIISVRSQKKLLFSQTINFIKPLPWAILGPFPDSELKGLDLSSPVEKQIANLHLRPQIKGYVWKLFEQGECYNSLGVIDFNKVFGRSNLLLHELGTCKDGPAAAYAVTCLTTYGRKHAGLVFAGDDCLQVWANGKPVLRVENNAPLETNQQITAVKMNPGVNTFVFKVPQTKAYWQLLFEPDLHFVYSRLYHIAGVPIDMWGKPDAMPFQILK